MNWLKYVQTYLHPLYSRKGLKKPLSCSRLTQFIGVSEAERASVLSRKENYSPPCSQQRLLLFGNCEVTVVAFLQSEVTDCRRCNVQGGPLRDGSLLSVAIPIVRNNCGIWVSLLRQGPRAGFGDSCWPLGTWWDVRPGLAAVDVSETVSATRRNLVKTSPVYTKPFC